MTDAFKPYTWMGWAIPHPNGQVFVQEGGTESDAWQIAFGWPTDAEIAQRKAEGAQAFRVRITEVSDRE